MQEKSGLALATFVQRMRSSGVQGPMLQWLIISMVSVGLGLCVVAVSYLPQQLAFPLLVILLGLFAVMIVGHIRKLFLAVALLDIPFQLDTYLFYRSDIAARGAIGGLNISVATLALAVLCGLWLADLLTKKDSPTRGLFYTNLPPALYLGVVTLSALVAHDVELAMFEIFLLGQTFFLCFYIVNTVRSRQDVLFVMTVLLIGLLLESLVMIGLRVIGHTIEIANITARIDHGVRVGGTIGSPNDAASYLTLLLTPAFSLLLTGLGRSYKLLGALAFSLGGIALILTLSRGGWIAFILSIVLFCFLAWRRGWLSLTIPLSLALIVILLALPFYEVIATRLTADDHGSAYSRVPLMEIAFQMIEDNPVFGVGANNFAIVMMQYAKLKISGAWLYTVHNQYLLIWAETGIIGLIAFIWFLLASLFRGWQIWRFNDRVLSILGLGLTACLVGHMVHLNVDLFHSRPQVQMLWLIAGLLVAMNNIMKSEVPHAG